MSPILCLLLLYTLIVAFLLPCALAGDPDPLTDLPMLDSTFSKNGMQSTKSFTLKDVFHNGDVSIGPGGTRAALNTQIFPAMMSQGLTYVQFQMKPCGVNLPHTHPRASEMLTLISGGPLQVGFVDTSGKAHIDILQAGDVTIFPRGLMHFEINVGSQTAFYISALDSQNPGTLTTGGALLNLPARALATALNQDLDSARKIAANIFPYGPALQMSSPSVCTPGKDVTTMF